MFHLLFLLLLGIWFVFNLFGDISVTAINIYTKCYFLFIFFRNVQAGNIGLNGRFLWTFTTHYQTPLQRKVNQFTDSCTMC